MLVNGVPMRTIWRGGDRVSIIDQTRLPHFVEMLTLTHYEDAVRAIAELHVQGAPLIGVTAAYGLALAMRTDSSDAFLEEACEQLVRAQPAAIHLRGIIMQVGAQLLACPEGERGEVGFLLADALAQEDVECNEALGGHGLALIRQAARRNGRVSILTHGHAGWLTTVDWGVATAPVYKAAGEGIDVHVLVSETRPRNPGAALTAWELSQQGIAHHLIADNASGHLMQEGRVDMVIVGADRVTMAGDVRNEIGAYLKALAAHDNGVPFYIAAPVSSIDFACSDSQPMPVEERAGRQVTHLAGMDAEGVIRTIAIAPSSTPALNPACDVTPARLVSGLITERGLCAASATGITALYPDRLTDH